MNIKKTTFGIIILTVTLFGFSNFANSANKDALLVSESISSGVVGNDLLVLLLELKALSLESEIFTDEAFINLKDFSTEIRPQPVGRNNPFASLGVDVEVFESVEEDENL